MITIFDGMQKMTKEQLSFEVALLEHITVADYARSAAEKVKRSSVRLVNKVSSLIGKGQLKEPEALTLPEQIAVAQESLMMKEEEELRGLLISNLRGRLQTSGIQNAQELSVERLSVLAVAKAGEAVADIPDAAMVLRKAEMIADKNTKRGPEDFRKTVLPGRLDREVLAHVVAALVRAYDAKLAPTYQSLPGFLTGEALAAFQKEDERIRAIRAGRERFESESASLKNAMKLSMDKAEVQKSTYRSLSEKEDTLLHKEPEGAGTDSGENGEEPGTYEAVLAETRSLMEESRRRQQEFEDEYNAKKAEIEQLEKKSIEEEAEIGKLVASRAKKISEGWTKAFAVCDFREGVIESVAENFVYDELIALEEALAELCLAENAENLDEPVTADRAYCSCTFYAQTGYAGRIAYRVKDGRILILQIQKGRDRKAQGI